MHRPAVRGRMGQAAMVAGAAGLALLLSGCGEGHQPGTSLLPQSDVGNHIQDLFSFITWAALVVFVVVEGALVLAILRFRRRPGQAAGPPVGRHGSTRLEIAWTLAPVIVLAVVAVPTVGEIFAEQAPAPGNAVQVQVIGHQWWWEFRYPQYHIVTASEMHLPVNRPVNISLVSADVIHSFWIGPLDGKRDTFPNHVNNIWFTPRTRGVYPGQCSEFCGESHAFMRMRAVVESPADFATWARHQAGPATAPVTAPARQGAAIFASATCAGCHTIAGTAAAGQIGPNLTHLASRSNIGDQELTASAADLMGWVHDSSDYKPGSKMPPQNLSTHDLRLVVAYLQSLK